MPVSDFCSSGFLGARVARVFGNCGFPDFLVLGLWWLLVFCFFGSLDSRHNLGFPCLAFEICGLLDVRSTRRAELAKVSVASLELLSDLVHSAGSGKRCRRRKVASYKGPMSRAREVKICYWRSATEDLEWSATEDFSSLSVEVAVQEGVARVVSCSLYDSYNADFAFW